MSLAPPLGGIIDGDEKLRESSQTDSVLMRFIGESPSNPTPAGVQFFNLFNNHNPLRKQTKERFEKACWIC